VQSEKYEGQLEQLDSQLREAEAVRKEIQYRLEYAGSQWEVKLRVFVKEQDQRTQQSHEQIKRIKALMEDLNAKGI